MRKLIDFINRKYVSIYYNLLKHLYFKYSETKYGAEILMFLHILMMKRIWFDKLSPKFDMTKHIETMSGENAKKIFRHVNHRLNSNFLNNREIEYTISFVIQYKRVIVSGLEDKEFDVPKKLVFVRFDTNHYPTHTVKPVKEIFTFAAQSYLQKGQIRHFKNIESSSERIFLEIENEDDLLRLKKMLNRFKMHFQIKNKPYTKRKFGKSETVLNTQEVYRRTFKYGEAMFLLCKLFNVKNDISEEVVTLKDLIS